MRQTALPAVNPQALKDFNMSNLTNDDGGRFETVQDRIDTYSRIIKSKLPYILDDDLLMAVYIFAANNYIGQGDMNYRIVCTINLTFRGSESDLLKDFPDVSEAVDILEAHYQTA